MRQLAKRLRDATLPMRTSGVAPSCRWPLPPRQLRQGGRHFATDEDFVTSGRVEAERLQELGVLADGAVVLDVGAGPGRFAVGLAEAGIEVGRYVGVEVQHRHVAWCRRHISRRDDRFEFVHVDAANRRYNPSGEARPELPVDDGSVDLAYAFSVLTHMDSGDVGHLLAELRRVLADGGAAAVTAFIEDGVADEVENPDGYGPIGWDGPLHCVRYERRFFTGLVGQAGLVVDRIDHGVERDGQTFVLLRRP